MCFVRTKWSWTWNFSQFARYTHEWRQRDQSLFANQTFTSFHWQLWIQFVNVRPKCAFAASELFYRYFENKIDCETCNDCKKKKKKKKENENRIRFIWFKNSQLYQCEGLKRHVFQVLNWNSLQSSRRVLSGNEHSTRTP